MSLERDIQQAEQALKDLVTDEVELFNLESDFKQQIHDLKQGGSFDFEELATLEGKRAALSSLLSEQRQRVAEARRELSTLQAQQAHLRQVEALRPEMAELSSLKVQAEEQLASLEEVITAALSELLDTRQVWAAKREQVARMAGQLFGLPDPARLDNGQSTAEQATRERWQQLEEVMPQALEHLQALPFSSDNPGKIQLRSGQPFSGPPAGPHELQAAREARLSDLFDQATRQAIYRAAQQAHAGRSHDFGVMKW